MSENSSDTQFITATDRDWATKLKSLQPTPGYCIFVDIVGSTALKDSSISEWCKFIHHTFNSTQFHIPVPIQPLKSIGDCLMYYIPEPQMCGETPLSLLAGLYGLTRHTDAILRDVRVSIGYCQDVYAVSFLLGMHDFYGKDIDLTSRLLAIAQSKEILMNEPFYQQVRMEFSHHQNFEQYPCMLEIQGPWTQTMKGFRQPLRVFKVHPPELP
ncbi:MAG: hypothetical protein WCO56_16370 [Verrucomicrobiota bacterium]